MQRPVAQMLGLDRVTLYSELAKLVLQDEDKTNKNRAIHMGLRMLGDSSPEIEQSFNVQIISNIPIAD